MYCEKHIFLQFFNDYKRTGFFMVKGNKSICFRWFENELRFYLLGIASSP